MWKLEKERERELTGAAWKLRSLELEYSLWIRLMEISDASDTDGQEPCERENEYNLELEAERSYRTCKIW